MCLIGACYTGSGVNITSTAESFDKVALFTNIQDIHEYYPESEKMELFNADIELSISQVSGRFAFNFGLKSLMSNYGSANSSAIWFSLEEDKLYAGLSYFAPDGTEVALIDKTSLGMYSGGKIKIALKAERSYGATNEDILSGSVSSGSNKMNIANVKGANATGYISFSENTKDSITHASVTECTILTYQYLVAKNTSDKETPALADFNSGVYNTNEWYSEGRLGYFDNTSIKVQDGKFRLTNAAKSSISTKFEYSNFTMSFEVSDIQKTAVGKGGTEAKDYNPQQAVKEQYDCVVSPGFYVLLGCLEYTGFYVGGAYIHFEPYTYSKAGDITAKSKIDYTKPFEYTRVTISDGSTLQYVLLEDNLWEVGNDNAKIFISMINGDFTLAYSINGGETKEVSGINDFSVVPYGYIKIGGMGHKENVGVELDNNGIGNQLKQLNMAFDNITLYNYDALAKAISVNYTPSSNGSGKDYTYVDRWNPSDMLGAK